MAGPQRMLIGIPETRVATIIRSGKLSSKEISWIVAGPEVSVLVLNLDWRHDSFVDARTRARVLSP